MHLNPAPQNPNANGNPGVEPNGPGVWNAGVHIHPAMVGQGNRALDNGIAPGMQYHPQYLNHIQPHGVHGQQGYPGYVPAPTVTNHGKCLDRLAAQIKILTAAV